VIKTKHFNDFLNDEGADSMLAFVIVGGVLMFGLTYLLLSTAFIAPISLINIMIDNGQLSAATTEHIITMLNMWRASPLFFLIALILFGYERSKGESVDSGMFFSYQALMIITLLTSTYLTWGLGTSTDVICNAFESNVWFTDYGAEFDVSYARVICITLMYYCCMLPGFIGSILFMLFPILKQRENSFLDTTDEYNGGGGGGQGEYITNYSLDQM
jgi:hypothetical protein